MEGAKNLDERQSFGLGSIIGASGPTIETVTVKKLTAEIDATATRGMEY